MKYCYPKFCPLPNDKRPIVDHEPIATGDNFGEAMGNAMKWCMSNGYNGTLYYVIWELDSGTTDIWQEEDIEQLGK